MVNVQKRELDVNHFFLSSKCKNMKNSRSKNYILHTLKNAKHITITQITCFCKILGNVALYNISTKTYTELIRISKDFENFKDFTIEDIK